MYTILCPIYSTTLYVCAYVYISNIVLMYTTIKYMHNMYATITSYTRYTVLLKEVSNTLTGGHTSDNVDTRAK